ncbi:hypothetical protein [Paenibacillus sinopodophylli]|uniref:hypothetical protein n=1 Tax=Paenibacillus sinopodophylli TaxID=1837342 RepID=UPI00110D18CD|nr:hypothetical protein [Paenibacillus sinopodophylli]
MRRNSLKWTLLGGSLAIVILYGIDVSSKGIERIYGPIEESGNYTEIVQQQEREKPVETFEMVQQTKIAELEKELEQLKRMAEMGSEEYTSEFEDSQLPDSGVRLSGVPVVDDRPAVNRIADSTSGLLQNMSSEGIRFVVSIFDGLTK